MQRRFDAGPSRRGWPRWPVPRRDADASVPVRRVHGVLHASQFVHIAPDETDTLDHIPRELLFAAPGWSRGTCSWARRGRQLPDAPRRRVLHLRASSPHVSHLRLPGLRRHRRQPRRRAKIGIAQRASALRFTLAATTTSPNTRQWSAAAAYVRDTRMSSRRGRLEPHATARDGRGSA